MKIEYEALRLLRTEYDSAQQDMELLLEAIDKRHQLLDSVDSRLDSELTSRHFDIQVHFIVAEFMNNLYKIHIVEKFVLIFCCCILSLFQRL